ncbi:MAG: hypothetical protein LBC44_02455 [Mycoplasmataceae bacterium]|nr:hypothetical protein [Mycoplasmataceae bacterium]
MSATLTNCSSTNTLNSTNFKLLDIKNIFDQNTVLKFFSQSSINDKTILNRINVIAGQEENVYREEIEVTDINFTSNTCKLKPKTDSFHYKQDTMTFGFQFAEHFKINDFFPNEDVNLSTNSGKLPSVCPDVISAYDLSMNYHDIPYEGNCASQQNHFYWDALSFDIIREHTLYQTGVNQLYKCLGSIKISLDDETEVNFNINQIEIDSITQNDNNNDKKYKVKLKTKSDSNFWVPNTSFYLYICADIYTPITTVREMCPAKTDGTPASWTGHYYLANNLTWDTTNDKQREMNILNLTGVFDGRYRKVKVQGFEGNDKIWNDNEYLFSGIDGWFRNMNLTLDINMSWTVSISNNPRRSIFNSTNIENVYLTGPTITASMGGTHMQGGSISVLSSLFLYSGTKNKKIEIKRVAIRATLDANNYKSEDGYVLATGTFWGTSQGNQGGNETTISEINNMVTYKNFPTTLGQYQKRWFGRDYHDSWQTGAVANKVNVSKVFDDFYNEVQYMPDLYPNNLLPEQIQITASNGITYNKTIAPEKSDYTFFDFNNYWYIPTSGNRPIPQKPWACFTGVFK